MAEVTSPKPAMWSEWLCVMRIALTVVAPAASIRLAGIGRRIYDYALAGLGADQEVRVIVVGTAL